VHKPHPISDQNGHNLYPISNRLKDHTLWRRTYLYSLYKGVPPPGNFKGCLEVQRERATVRQRRRQQTSVRAKTKISSKKTAKTAGNRRSEEQETEVLQAVQASREPTSHRVLLV